MTTTHDVSRRCEVEECSRPFRARGCCAMHYQRLMRWGHPLVGGTFQGTDEVGYYGAHMRVRRLLGPAKNHQCDACTKPAYDWAYTGSEKELTYQREGRAPLIYSPDVTAYRPLCRSCHLRERGKKVAQ